MRGHRGEKFRRKLCARVKLHLGARARITERKPRIGADNSVGPFEKKRHKLERALKLNVTDTRVDRGIRFHAVGPAKSECGSNLAVGKVHRARARAEK